MKSHRNRTRLLILLFATTFSALYSQNPEVYESSKSLYDQLRTVNQEWNQIKFADQILTEPLNEGNYYQRIGQHLQLVSEYLAEHTPVELTTSQSENRRLAISILANYSLAGIFPVNSGYPGIRPCFIDTKETHCAVGYLMKETGFGEVAKKVAKNGNYDYVREMNYPELFAWAGEYGFTVDELAWIQPAYPPPYTITEVGGGVNGFVNTIVNDTANNLIYIGGTFTKNTNDGQALNIAAWDGTTWYKLGDGVNDAVRKIFIFQNELYIGGDFTMSGSTTINHIAKWDGNAWLPLLQGTDGPVLAFEEYANELYIGGNFNLADSIAVTNIVTWTGTNFSANAPGLNGPVHTLKNFGNGIVAGGEFSTDGISILSNIAQFDGSQWSSLDSGLDARVNDLEIHQGNLFAAGTITDSSETWYYGMAIWNGNLWDSLISRYFVIDPDSGIMSSKPYSYLYFEDLVEYKGHLFAGGRYHIDVGMTFGDGISEVFTDSSGSGSIYFQPLAAIMDGEVRCIEIYDEFLHFGGTFTNIDFDTVAGIAKSDYTTGMIESGSNFSFEIFPNPASDQATIRIPSSSIFVGANFVQASLLDLTGKEIRNWKIASDEQQLDLSDIPSGVYLVRISSEGRPNGLEKIVIN